MAIRSRGAVSANDLLSLTLRSHLRPRPFLLDEAEVITIQSGRTLSDYKDSTLKAKARSAATNTRMLAKDKLK